MPRSGNVQGRPIVLQIAFTVHAFFFELPDFRLELSNALAEMFHIHHGLCSLIRCCITADCTGRSSDDIGLGSTQLAASRVELIRNIREP